MECNCSSNKGRNLVVCIDGTSNQFGPKNTNVIELYSQIIKSPNQLTYYNSGIGTYAKPSWKSWSYMKQALANKVDLAIAWNFEKIIISAYRWLSENYQENDRIYLFGFSRGAYQVRTLAGMIHKVGLIHKGNEDQIPFAYELYLDQESGEYTPPQSRTFLQQLRARPQPTKDKPINLAERFKMTFSHENVKVHFVGVWDTVSSIGIIRGKSLPLTDTVDHVCFVRHALALDERRVKFLPEYGSKMAQPNDPQKFAMVPRVKEVWFPGTHSDIGGGNRLNLSLNLGKTPALWMSFEAICCGLSLKPNKVDWDWEHLGQVQESLTSVWRLFEWIPFKRLTYKDGTSTTYRLHRGRGRKMWPGQKIHASVAFCPSTYRPQAILPPGSALSSWDERIHESNDECIKWLTKQHHIFEMDMFDLSGAEITMSRLSSKQGDDYELWLQRLVVMTGFFEGRSALLNAHAITILGTLLRDGLEDVQSKAIHALVALCQDKIPAIQEDEVFNILVHTIGSRHAANIRSLAVRCLTHISLGKPRWRKILENRTLEAVSELLMDDDHRAVSETLGALGELLQYGEFRAMLLTGGTIAIAQTLLITRGSTDVLQVLADHEGPCARLLSDLVVAASVEMLGSRQSHTVVELASISTKRPQLQIRLFDDAMVATIRKLLDSGDESAIKTAMGMLSSVTNHGDLRGRIFDDAMIAAMIPAVTKMLGSHSAVEWLSSVANHDDLRSRLFDDTMMAAMTAAIINMLGGSDSSAREAALNLLSMTTNHEDLRAGLFVNATQAAIPKLLNSDDYQEKDTALKLFSLAAKYEDLRAGLFDNATKATISKLLDSNSYRTHKSAIELLSLAANHEDLRTTVFDDAIMSAVKGLLRSENRQSVDASLQFLSVAMNHEDLLTRLFDVAIKAAIPELLINIDQRYGAREIALGLLSTTVNYENLRTTVFDNDIIPAIKRLLRSDRSSSLDIALKVLSMAANHRDIRTRMFDDAMRAAMMPAIPRVLDIDSESSIETALKLLPFAVNHGKRAQDLRTKLLDNVKKDIIRYLPRGRGDLQGDYVLKLLSIAANHDDLRTELFDSAVVAAFRGLLGGDKRRQETALKLLSITTNHEDLRTRVFEDTTIAAMIPAIAGMLGSDTGSMSDTAVQLLFLCANHGDLITKLFDDSVKAAIAKLLDSNSYVQRETALTLLTMAVNHEDLRTWLFDDAIGAAVVKLLTYDHHGRKQNPVMLLSKAADYEDLRTRLFDTKMKAAVVRLLHSESYDQRDTALDLLSMTASHAELRAGLFYDAMQTVIPKLLSTVFYREKDTALKLLLVAANYGDLRARLFDDAMKAAIPELLCNRGYSARETAVQLLSLAANHADLQRRCFDNAMISAIIAAIRSLLDSEDELERTTAMMALSMAANSDDLRTQVFNNTLIPAMIPVIRDLLCSRRESAREVALKLLSTAADHEDLRGRLFDDVTRSVIPNVFVYDHYGVRETALELLSLMANRGELRPMLLVNRVMLAVRNILSQDIPQTASQALNFLAKAANYAEFGVVHDMALSFRSSGDDASHRPLLTGRSSSRPH